MKINVIIRVVICFLVNISLCAQNHKIEANSKNICNKATQINSKEFLKNKQEYTRMDSITSYNKVKGVIKITTKDSVLTFKDHKVKNNLIEYSVVGQDKKNNWVLLLKEDYNQDYYYLINQNNNQVEKLVGYPLIFRNKILCQEGFYTDSTAFIEIWNTDKGNLKLETKFSLNPCNILDVNDLYLKKNVLYIKYNTTKFLKLKL